MKGAQPFTHVRHYGTAPRKALAIHCTLAHSGAWSGVAKALSDVLTITAYDLPGHGRSSDWDGVTDIHAQSTEMARDLLNEPMDVIGHSFGATVALRLAIEYPHLVRSVTMIEPVYFAPAIADEPERVAAHFAQAPDYVGALKRGDAEAAARAFNGGWGGGSAWDDIPEGTRKYMQDRIHIVPAGHAMLTEDNAGLLAPGAFERAAMPALLIEGALSGDVMDAINGAIARRLPNARRVVVDGAGHMVPLTHPQRVADEVRKLLEVV